jgi:hypothetical protein
MAGDEDLPRRVAAYRKGLAVWWVLRVCRYIYETPRGLDRRPAPPPAGWQERMAAHYTHYLALAEALLAE